uniref:U15-Liphistoxin-Lth1a_1 n=1 Tax=Liphistius thaleban TaxID=1905330 RepID=A0A4Q8K6J2_9ARAC
MKLFLSLGMEQTLLFLFFFFPAAWSLECYVCTNQDDNEDKCIKTIKTCDLSENRCLSEIRWGSTPYWDSTGKKQYYITKSCATEHHCKKVIKGYSTRCDRIWYNDWECVECCHGDRCNYYATLAGENVRLSGKIFIVLFCIHLLLRRIF